MPRSMPPGRQQQLVFVSRRQIWMRREWGLFPDVLAVDVAEVVEVVVVD